MHRCILNVSRVLRRITAQAIWHMVTHAVKLLTFRLRQIQVEKKNAAPHYLDDRARARERESVSPKHMQVRGKRESEAGKRSGWSGWRGRRGWPSRESTWRRANQFGRRANQFGRRANQFGMRGNHKI
jgi:hypothetical protein